jgi:hypothetical protein
MDKLIYPICSSLISQVAKALMDCINVAFCLAIRLVVLAAGYHKFDLKVVHKLLPEV